MCMNTSELNSCHLLHSNVHQHHRWKRPKVRIHRLNRRRRLSKEAKVKARVWKREMKMKNLKLYIQNKSIIEENEKLRNKALFLHKENRALISQLQEVTRSHNHLPHNNNKR